MWANVFYKLFSDRYFLTLKKKGPIKLWCAGTNMRFWWDPVQISKNNKKYLKMNMNT